MRENVKRERLWGSLGLLALVVAVVILYVQYNNAQQRDLDDAMDNLIAVTSEVEVEYCWRGSARSVDVTVTNSTGGTDSLAGKANFQCVDYSVPQNEVIVFMVQNNTERGSVTCDLSFDGREVEASTSSGQWATASCSGMT